MAQPAEVPYFPDDRHDIEEQGHGDRGKQNFAAATAPHPTTSTPSRELLPEHASVTRPPADRLYQGSTDRGPQVTSRDAMNESLSAALERFRPAFERFQRTMRRTRRRVEEVKEEKPLQVIALIAGSMFAMGMVIRFWRSRS